MNYKVDSIPFFDKQAKRLSKKYPSLKSDLKSLGENISIKPNQGNSLGNNFYKIRLSITSKGKGKSGGARIITYVKIIETTVYLVYIFDKSEKENISDKELQEAFKLIP